MRKILKTRYILGLMLFNPVLHAADLQYSISPIISDPLISTSITVTDINDSGQIVGSYRNLNNTQTGNHAFISSETNGTRVMTDIGSLSNGSNFYATAHSINNLGQIVGKSSVDAPANTFPQHAFVAQEINNTWVMTDLTPTTTSPNINHSSAHSIGDSGDIVGKIFYNNPTPGTGSLLGNLFIAEKSGSSWAKTDFEISTDPLTNNSFSINNNRQIIGTLATRRSHSMRTSYIISKENTNWNTLTTAQFSSDRLVLEGINDNNQIVGYNQDSVSTTKPSAFIATFNNNAWSVTDLGVFEDESTRAYDINDAGLIVGVTSKRVRTRWQPIKAILFADGQTHDLKTLITEGGGQWSSLKTVSAINNQDQIIGYGTYNGKSNTPFLMTPIAQEPLHPPVCELGADPQTIKKGEGLALWWWSDAVVSASIDNNINSVTTPSGYNWVYPTKTTTFTMTAQGNDGTSTTCATTITVEGQVEENSPYCEIGADPEVINLGEGSALWWWTENAPSASVDNGIGSVTTPSNYTWFYPTQTKTYTMNVVNDSGSTTSCNVIIRVVQ